jgi:hypothetical protein
MPRFLRSITGLRALRGALVLAVALGATALPASAAGAGRFAGSDLTRNDFNNCATGFHFTAPQVSFGGIPFDVDASANARALTVGTSFPECAATPVDAGVIRVGARGGTLWLLGASNNDLPFPNDRFGVAVTYADGTQTQATVQEVHTGLTGFIENCSCGQNVRPDLAVYSTPITGGGLTGTGYVYEHFVDLDANKTVDTVTISSLGTQNTAFIYGATLDKRGTRI